MKIKVCGMREAENIREVDRLQIDWMGFIFHPASPRYVATVPDALPCSARRVGVFVNSSDAVIWRAVRAFGLTTLQFHGAETPAQCRSWREQGFEIFKALPVGSCADLQAAEAYQNVCDYLVFDTRSTLPGGSGRSFDWSYLKAYRDELPFLLSGGITPSSLEALQTLRHPAFQGIDLNSGFESAPGLKDPKLLRAFITALRQTPSSVDPSPQV